ncbi:unnamed protein product [[Candida] boidinii]|nr:hypothetical protein BVG19_g5343 [[Candida] boidinii]OWB48549.1 hypothetical protein B5S27_g84 [[Candida] boidinii]GME87109.1 unnamed protein product [[Candida] boidinii]
MSFKYVFNNYIKFPDTCNTLVFNDENVIIIKDQFPKSVCHYLIIPKSKKFTNLNPIIAFDDLEFRELISIYITKAKELVKNDFLLRFQIKDVDDSNNNLFDIDDYITVGCHTIPSLVNLHIHVITNDFKSDRLKNRKHYNSFNTGFLIKFSEFPLSKDDFRRVNFKNENLIVDKYIKKTDLIYNGENFGNKFKLLKINIDKNFNKKFYSLENKAE